MHAHSNSTWSEPNACTAQWKDSRHSPLPGPSAPAELGSLAQWTDTELLSKLILIENQRRCLKLPSGLRSFMQVGCLNLPTEDSSALLALNAADEASRREKIAASAAPIGTAGGKESSAVPISVTTREFSVSRLTCSKPVAGHCGMRLDTA